MNDFINATVVFREQVTVGNVAYGGEMVDEEVRREESWVHIRSVGDPTEIHSFPVAVIACVAWTPTGTDA